MVLTINRYFLKRSYLVASLLFFSLGLNAQQKNNNEFLKPICIATIESNPGAIAVDENNNPLTPLKNYNFLLFIDVLKNKKLNITQLKINNKKIIYQTDSFFTKKQCIGLKNISGDSLNISPTSTKTAIMQLSLTNFLPSNKKNQKVEITISSKQHQKIYTFYIPNYSVQSLIQYQ